MNPKRHPPTRRESLLLALDKALWKLHRQNFDLLLYASVNPRSGDYMRAKRTVFTVKGRLGREVAS